MFRPDSSTILIISIICNKWQVGAGVQLAHLDWLLWPHASATGCAWSAGPGRARALQLLQSLAQGAGTWQMTPWPVEPCSRAGWALPMAAPTHLKRAVQATIVVEVAFPLRAAEGLQVLPEPETGDPVRGTGRSYSSPQALCTGGVCCTFPQRTGQRAVALPMGSRGPGPRESPELPRGPGG